MGDGSRQNHRGGPRRFSSGASAASTVFGRETLLSMQLQPSFSACLTPVRALILLFVLAAFPIGTIAGTLVWTNTAGGAWTNAANWSPNQVPAAADEAIITNAGVYTVTITANASASLTLGGPGGTATIQHTAGTLTLGNASRIVAGGNLTWSGGTLAGALTVASNGYFILEGGALKTLHAAVTNQGTIHFGGTAECYAYGNNGARVENFGVFEFVTDRELYGISGSPVFRNSGVLRKTGGTGTARLGVAGSYPVVLANTGLIESQSGVLQLFGGGTVAGEFVAGAGTRIELVGGTFTQTTVGVPVVSGSGTTRLTGGTLQLHDQIANLQLFGGTVALL